jgi:polyisoprenoid-binding protein YceI
VEVRIAVDMASLDTGIGLRNSHMRDNHLETDEFPEAVFTGTRITGSSASTLAPGRTESIVVAGVFSLHGVDRERTLEAELTLTSDGTLHMRCAFEVKLSEHDIERPKFLVMKLADEQQVTIDLTARAAR